MPAAFHPKQEPLTSWAEVTAAFDKFPAPRFAFDLEGYPSRTDWIFRGHKKLGYQLRPSIERATEWRPGSWAVLEDMILDEFQSKARLHVAARDLPPLDQRLSWLALMQHYSVPTRLLDFTYSPYVALYFALRDRSDDERKERAAVWAVNAAAILEKAKHVSTKANAEQSKAPNQSGGKARLGWLLRPAPSFTERQMWSSDAIDWRSAIEKALEPTGRQGQCFNENGFVAFALPTTQNQRLSSQQGAFLFNAAESLTFEGSLSKLMEHHDGQWCRLLSIPTDVAPEFETKLFQMNIHDLSLFPDMRGLAGFIRQKTQLHWLVPG